MTIAHLCLFVACLLPIACAGIAKSKGFGKKRRDGGFDNHNPRAWLGDLTGWQARAHAAQANCWEALPIFIAGLVVAHQRGVAPGMVDALAGAFLAARLGFIAAYLADTANLRSLLWLAGLVASLALFFVR
jgi:uncharacterized MAPEG superfamily protein